MTIIWKVPVLIPDIVKIITDLERQCNENVKKITKFLRTSRFDFAFLIANHKYRRGCDKINRMAGSSRKKCGMIFLKKFEFSCRIRR